VLLTSLRDAVVGLSVCMVSASLIGCGSGLKLVPLQSAASKPSNVAVYFTVDTRDGKPVGNLAADQFTIYEDGSKVSTFESKQTILNPKVASAHYTLLLIDMSGSIVAAKDVDEVIKAASAFTERVEKSQNVAVYAFDGSTDLYPIVPFTNSESAATGGVERLTTFKPKDPSTNLNGAVVAGMKVLKKSLAADTKALKFGTLVVFTDGTDRANRVPLADLRTALSAPENAKLEIFAVGVGAELDNARLGEIGRSGTISEPDRANVQKGFDAVAGKIEAAAARYYLLSYCTPSRAGAHEVRIEAHAPDGSTGDLTYGFSADGFGPGCDPTTPSGFDLAHPPTAVVEKKGEKKDPQPKKPVAPKPHVSAPAQSLPPGATIVPAPAPAPPPASDPFAP
jgi:hypothetical protein